MNDAKFTPGPWEVVNVVDVFTMSGAANNSGVMADSVDGWQIADCSVGRTFVGGELIELGFKEQAANARLIAAAPELYEALEKATMLLDGVGFQSSDEYQAAMHALAKARGES